MSSVLNKLAAALSAIGLGALAADMTGMADVPDSTGAQVVYVLAILGGLLWRTLPDQDDTPGPDILQAGGSLDWRKWLQNLGDFLKPPTAALLRLTLTAGCGGTQGAEAFKWTSQTCSPIGSDNCLVVQGSGTEVRVIQKPDFSIETEFWTSLPGAGAYGSVSADPETGQIDAEGCVEVLLWEECASSEE